MRNLFATPRYDPIRWASDKPAAAGGDVDLAATPVARPTPGADLDMPLSPGGYTPRTVRMAPAYRPVRKWRRPAAVALLILAVVIAGVVLAQWLTARKKKATMLAIADRVADRVFGGGRSKRSDDSE